MGNRNVVVISGPAGVLAMLRVLATVKTPPQIVVRVSEPEQGDVVAAHP
jgi:hypothetical protein